LKGKKGEKKDGMGTSAAKKLDSTIKFLDWKTVRPTAAK